MPFSDIKIKFVALTGRDDLTAVGANPDASFFINAGQRFLDRMFSSGKATARYFENLVLGQIITKSVGIRAIKRVYVYDADGRTLVEKAWLEKLREYYTKPKASIVPGKPQYYAPICLRPYPNAYTVANYNQQWAFQDVLAASHWTYNGILFMPPADVSGKYVLEVWGLFYTDALSLDADASYWTEVHPELLIKAAAYELEVFYRNTEGANDWLIAVKADAAGIDMDIVEEEIADVDTMEVKAYEINT